jgi:hypothetical protein
MQQPSILAVETGEETGRAQPCMFSRPEILHPTKPLNLIIFNSPWDWQLLDDQQRVAMVPIGIEPAVGWMALPD